MYPQVPDQYIGCWEDDGKTTVLEIYLIENMYNGRISTFDKPAIKKDILIQMKRKKDILFGGTFYDTESHREYEVRIRLVNDSVFVMKVFSGFFRKRSKWHKVGINHKHQ